MIIERTIIKEMERAIITKLKTYHTFNRMNDRTKKRFVDLVTVPGEVNGSNFTSPPPPINQMTLVYFPFFLSLDDNTTTLNLLCLNTDTISEM